MRHLLIAAALAAPLLLARLEAAAAPDWHVADQKDVPGEVKKALIAESDKQSGNDEVTGFTYYQTGIETKDTRFKAEWRAGGKQWVVICKPDGTIESSQAAGDAAPADAPKPSPTPGPKAPSP
jgi:hypothetical protein